jgi:hypothetical protein
MKLNILPLEGKYYGTNIEIIDGKEKTMFTVWHTCGIIRDTYEPSQRQLKKYNVNRKKWHDEDFGCDNHYESKYTYNLLLKIKKLLEGNK